jgi:transglutaminase-like putative cysteine protease
MKKMAPFLVILFFTGIMMTCSVTGIAGKTGDDNEYKGFDQVVVYDSTLVDVQESGLTYMTNHSLTRVLTPKGAMELNVVKFGYDPLSAFIEIRSILIHRKSGETEVINVKQVMDYPAPARAIYWGAREKMVEVGRLEPGDAVETVLFRKGFTYALLQGDEDDKYIPPMRGQFYDIVEFFHTQPVISKVYQVRAPKDKPLQYEFYNGEVGVSCKFSGDLIVYTFTGKDLRPAKQEPRMVAATDVFPKLLLSTTPRWEEKSTWFFGVNEDFGSFDTTPDIKAKTDEILKGAVDEMDSVSRLTHWVADEIRYSGISMGCGEGFTLHKGDMTFRDRCGVCKDKAGMLITMLRAAGFKSYPAMTMAGSRIDRVVADQFNHCVTVVKLRDGKYHLLDPTWVPFVRELWSSAEQQQEYLMGVPEGADLASTPVSDPEKHYLKIDGASEMMKDGTLKGRITITGEGQSDASVRGLFRSTRNLWYQNVERELLKLYPQAKITQVKYTDPGDYMNYNIWVAIDFIIPSYALVSEGKLMFVPLSAQGIFRNFQPHLGFETTLKERKYAFRDRCSRLLTLNESITLPSFKKITRLPGSIKTGGAAVSFEGGYRALKDALVFNATARYGKRIYDSADWPEFRAAVEAQSKFADQFVVVEVN